MTGRGAAPVERVYLRARFNLTTFHRKRPKKRFVSIRSPDGVRCNVIGYVAVFIAFERHRLS